MKSFFFILSVLSRRILEISCEQEFTKLLPMTFIRQRHFASELDVYDDSLVSYELPISIDSTQFYVTLDTGSADFWIPSNKCSACHVQLKLQCGKKGSSCAPTSEQMWINYDDGYISGTVAHATVKFGPQLVLSEQSFMLVDDASGNIQNCKGIFGLGMAALQSNSEIQPLENLKKQKLIETLMFSLYLDKIEGSFNSKIIFGGYDRRLLQNQSEILIFSPIISDSTYTIQITGLKLNHLYIPAESALIDSGTTCITFPSYVFQSLFRVFEDIPDVKCTMVEEDQSPNYSYMACFVDEIQQLPVLTIQIHEQNLQISPEDYIFQCSSFAEKLYCETKFESSTADYQIILGDGFLTSFYTVFDLEKKQIGFGHAKKLLEIHKHSVNGALRELNPKKQFFVSEIHKKMLSERQFSKIIRSSLLFVGSQIILWGWAYLQIQDQAAKLRNTLFAALSVVEVLMFILFA